MKKGLLIIGTLPTTGGVGGVTVHIERMLQYLEYINYSYDFFDYKGESLYKVFVKMRKAKLVHAHISNPYFMFFVALCCLFMRTKLVITLHGKYVERGRKPWPLISFYIKKATVPIVLNETSLVTCRKLNKRAIQIPAFIPPQKEEALNGEVLKMIDNIYEQGKRIVVTYAFDVVYEDDGKEIYGIDFLISYFLNRKDYALIISDPSGNYKKKYEKISTNVHFINYPHSLYEVVKRADIFIRNTSKDGDSLSVKEALYLKKRVLCTDVVERPGGVELFKFCDKESLDMCLETTTMFHPISIESGEKHIVELYKTMLNS